MRNKLETGADILTMLVFLAVIFVMFFFTLRAKKVEADSKLIYRSEVSQLLQDVKAIREILRTSSIHENSFE